MRRVWLVLSIMPACGRIGFDYGVVASDDGAVLGGDGAGGGGGDGGGGGGDGGDGRDGAESPYNRVFVTSIMVTPGSLGGLAGADLICGQRAAAAGLTGSFVAWLSTSTTNARDRLGSARGWERTDGLPVVNEQAKLFAGGLVLPIHADEFGQPVPDDAAAVVVTATNPDGTLSSEGSCGDFASTSGQVAVGRPLATAGRWTAASTVACSQPTRLYCFENDKDATWVLITFSARYAWLATGWTPGSGINNADMLCRDQANLVGAPGTYQALLATATASAASRFVASGAPWQRLDGINLGTTAFLAGTSEAPLNYTIYGTYVDARVWTGAAGDGTSADAVPSADRACNVWRDATSTLVGGLGFASESASMSFDGRTTSPCDQPLGIYCLQE